MTTDSSTASIKQEFEMTWPPGHLPHNLFSWNEDGVAQLASCSGCTVQMVGIEENLLESGNLTLRMARESVLSDKSCTVIQAKVLEIENQLILVIITENNIQFHDIRRNCVLYTFIPQSKIQDENDDRIESFARGITHLRFFIFIGLHSGAILVLSRLSDGCITYEDSIAASSNVPITDISADECTVVTGDSEGGVIVREPDGQLILKTVVEFEGFNSFPASAVAVCGDIVLAAYGSGHLRIFSILQKRLLSEVHAHLSWINCMDVRKDDGDTSCSLITGSDDSMIRVWQIQESYPWIRSEAAHCLKNMMVTGVSFFGKGMRFASVGYDVPKVFIFDAL